MFISPAYAQGAGGQDVFGMMLPLILIFVVFYFLLIRPQQKKQKEHREMLGALRRGDRVVTAGGVIGTITRVNSDTELTVEIADGVRVKVVRGMVSDVIAKTEARDSGGGDADEPEEDEDSDTAAKRKKKKA